MCACTSGYTGVNCESGMELAASSFDFSGFYHYLAILLLLLLNTDSFLHQKSQ